MGCIYQQGIGSFNTRFEKLLVGMKKIKDRIFSSCYSLQYRWSAFRNRDPEYSASYVDKAFSVNGLLSYDAKKSKTTFGYRVYKTPDGMGNLFK